MRLTKLELTGFKSFADTATLTFQDGVTAIVGPKDRKSTRLNSSHRL